MTHHATLPMGHVPHQALHTITTARGRWIPEVALVPLAHLATLWMLLFVLLGSLGGNGPDFSEKRQFAAKPV